jgi:hypothetical protein
LVYSMEMKVRHALFWVCVVIAARALAGFVGMFT